jgi:putative ATPase
LLLTLRPLADEDVIALLERAVVDSRGLGGAIGLTADSARALADLATGDARRPLTYLEEAAASAQAQGLAEISSVDRAIARYDRDGDQHYDIISACIKSMRGSDPQAALHWLARMIEAGKDVGMAGPSVLPVAVAAAQAVALIGMPEARINLAQAAITVATRAGDPSLRNLDPR